MTRGASERLDTSQRVKNPENNLKKRKRDL